MRSLHRRSPVDSARSLADQFEEIAADWIARRNAPNFGAAEEAELRAWLAADPRHQQAFDEMNSAWTALQGVRHAGRAETMWIDLEGRVRRRGLRRTLHAFAASGLAAAALVMFAFVTRQPTPTAAVASRIIALQPDRQTLPDGSTVELHGAAEIAVDYASDRRNVRLLRGEALFSVMPDASRPFVVAAGGVEVQAVGTAFVVRHAASQIDVMVTEGRVQVARVLEPLGTTAPPVRSEPIDLDAGSKVVVPATMPETARLEVVPMSVAALNAALAWRNWRIQFAETPLLDAVALFNTQNRLQLSLGDPALARRSVTGVFWTDDPEGFVRLLELGFGVSAERRDDTVILRGQ